MILIEVGREPGSQIAVASPASWEGERELPEILQPPSPKPPTGSMDPLQVDQADIELACRRFSHEEMAPVKVTMKEARRVQQADRSTQRPKESVDSLEGSPFSLDSLQPIVGRLEADQILAEKELSTAIISAKGDHRGDAHPRFFAPKARLRLGDAGPISVGSDGAW